MEGHNENKICIIFIYFVPAAPIEIKEQVEIQANEMKKATRTTWHIHQTYFDFRGQIKKNAFIIYSTFLLYGVFNCASILLFSGLLFSFWQ